MTPPPSSCKSAHESATSEPLAPPLVQMSSAKPPCSEIDAVSHPVNSLKPLPPATPSFAQVCELASTPKQASVPTPDLEAASCIPAPELKFEISFATQPVKPDQVPTAVGKTPECVIEVATDEIAKHTAAGSTDRTEPCSQAAASQPFATSAEISQQTATTTIDPSSSGKHVSSESQEKTRNESKSCELATSLDCSSSRKRRVLNVFESTLTNQEGQLSPEQLQLLLSKLVNGMPEDRMNAVVEAARKVNASISYTDFIDWVFDASMKHAKRSEARGWGKMIDDLYKGELSLSDIVVQVSFAAQLQQLIEDHPYLEPGCTYQPHPLQHWIKRCRESFQAKKFAEAQKYLHRAIAGLDMDKRQIEAAFRRFDANGNGYLDANECRNMCAYLGWGLEEFSQLDLDKDGRISLPEYQTFIGRQGGIQQLFSARRARMSASRNDVCDHAGLSVGSRVRAHFYVRGQKSRSWREAQVLAVGVERRPLGVEGPVTYGVLLEFGFTSHGNQRNFLRARQVVPPTWVVSGVEDAQRASALREIGILDEEQAFWAALLPESEMQAVERLVDCQRQALSGVRAHASASHEQAKPKVMERFECLGYGHTELETVLHWIQDLAPIIIHLNLDKMGALLETDEFYRNQFETKTSSGTLEAKHQSRTNWEHDLFGGAYDNAKDFDRCKYGALNVMNDYRGAARARGYGDSYLVLKDVRLRCTFTYSDSGGLHGSELGVLDRYCHVLSKYNDQELKGLVDVAMAATSRNSEPSAHPELLSGSNEDVMRAWGTFGFPKLAQKEGRLYFEVLLFPGCAAPQVGLLSSGFACKRSKSACGVGDDINGWAADGQNAALWHNGKSRPWNRLWPTQDPSRCLGQELVVGVAVDLDNQQIWFSTDGAWDERPAFDDLPKGIDVYPALSVRGKAAFCFGPAFRYAQPENHAAYCQWPGGVSGIIRVDAPHVGNEELLTIYKEAQIHGEVNLRRNVQRLVAAQKYRDLPKTQRSYSLRIADGAFQGTYQRVGAHDERPLYRSSTGAIIYWDAKSAFWYLSAKEDFECWQFRAAQQTACEEPPRIGWHTRDIERGAVDQQVFRTTLEKLTLPQQDIDKIVKALSAQVQGETLIHRVNGSITLQEEWGNLNKAPCSVEELWSKAIKEMQVQLLAQAGLPGAEVVETDHPYAAKLHSWSKEVEMQGAAGIVVHFASRSCTLDDRTRCRIFTGGLRRSAAGAGARVEVAVPGGDKVWGTVTSRDSEHIWTVKLDQEDQSMLKPGNNDWPQAGDKVEARYRTGKWHMAIVNQVFADGRYILDWFDGLMRDREKKKEDLRRPQVKEFDHRNLEDLPRYALVPSRGDTETLHSTPCFARCLDNPAVIKVLFSSTSVGDEQGRGFFVGDEIIRFGLDRSCPLMPITVEAFADRHGPAQEHGVKLGWYLDFFGTLGLPGKSNKKLFELLHGMGGIDTSNMSMSNVLDSAFQDIDELHRRLNTCLLEMTDVLLIFTNSCSGSQVQLLPEAYVSYPRNCGASDEIQGFYTHKKKMCVKGFKTKGPAQEAGVRTDWLVNLQQTLAFNKHHLPAHTTEQTLLKNPMELLQLHGATIVFQQPSPTKTEQFQVSGPVGTKKWKPCFVAGDYVELQFSTDGDSGYNPDIHKLTMQEKRWGIMALVASKKDCHAVSQDVVDAFATQWVEKRALAVGVQGFPQVERDGWHESRLRALCKQYGWDFEWMSEDGERRRRLRERWDELAIPAQTNSPLLVASVSAPGPEDEARPDRAWTAT